MLANYRKSIGSLGRKQMYGKEAHLMRRLKKPSGGEAEIDTFRDSRAAAAQNLGTSLIV